MTITWYVTTFKRIVQGNDQDVPGRKISIGYEIQDMERAEFTNF